jgi:hypothetical protein
LRKLTVVLGGLDEVQQLFAHQIFQRVAKSNQKYLKFPRARLTAGRKSVGHSGPNAA